VRLKFVWEFQYAQAGPKTAAYNGLLRRVAKCYHATSAAAVFAGAVKLQIAAGFGDAAVYDRQSQARALCLGGEKGLQDF
jgi:hypothetical protein